VKKRLATACGAAITFLVYYAHGIERVEKSELNT
jgi:hypothetical protein